MNIISKEEFLKNNKTKLALDYLDYDGTLTKEVWLENQYKTFAKDYLINHPVKGATIKDIYGVEIDKILSISPLVTSTPKWSTVMITLADKDGKSYDVKAVFKTAQLRGDSNE